MKTVPLRRLGVCLDGQRVPLNSGERADMAGTVPYWGANGVVDFVDRELFDEELVLLGEDGAPFDIANRDVAFLVNEPVWVNNHIHVLRPSQNVTAAFLTYALNATNWMPYVTGSTRLKLTQERMMQAPIPEWSLSSQRKIAGFLDRETERIDALIDKKRSLIDLLGEKRAATITHLTTIKEAPFARLGRFVDLTPGYAFSSSDFSDHGVRLLRGINLSPGTVRWDETVHWEPDDPIVASIYSLRKGDIIIGMDRPWISGGMRVAKIGTSDVPSLLVQRVARLRTDHELDQGFLYAVLQSLAFKAYFDPILTGISIPHISGEQILNYACTIPAIEKQRMIARKIESTTNGLSLTTERITTQLTLLGEYREALITAAVTGEIDVDTFDTGHSMKETTP